MMSRWIRQEWLATNENCIVVTGWRKRQPYFRQWHEYLKRTSGRAWGSGVLRGCVEHSQYIMADIAERNENIMLFVRIDEETEQKEKHQFAMDRRRYIVRTVWPGCVSVFRVGDNWKNASQNMLAQFQIEGRQIDSKRWNMVSWLAFRASVKYRGVLCE